MLDRRQFGHLHRVARAAQQPAVGDLLAADVVEAGAGAGRLDQPTHHLPRQIGQQDLALVGGIEDGALAERGGEDLALGAQRLDLLADQARFELAEVEKPDRKQRQGQYVDGDDPPGQR